MPPKAITQKSLIRIFKGAKENKSSETRFCFLLGAGASISSGIPMGGQLAKRWYEVLQEDLEPEELEVWKKEVGFDEKRIAEFYTDLYQKRFEPSPEDRYNEFTTLMENKEPGIGYVILAQVLAKEPHNFVITTNFDYLVEDAVRMYTSQKPFSAGHETLAPFISSRTKRPTIIKVHRDLFLHPFNQTAETDTLKEEWEKALYPILRDFHLLVIGYGGNDGSLMNYLNTEDRKAIYWCKRKQDKLSDKVNKLLKKKDFIVTIEGFDELMVGLYDAYDYDIFEHLDTPEEHKFVQDAKRRVNDLNTKRNDILKQKDLTKDTSRNVKSLFEKGASEYIYRASIVKHINIKEEIYLAGIKKYPEDTNLLNSYGVYLGEFRKNYEKAIEYYQKAIEIKPDKHEAFHNWGNTLGEMAKTKSGVEAETLSYQAIKKYEKAIEINPNNYESFHGWGNVLIKLAHTKSGGDKETLLQEAIKKFQKTIEIKPDYYSGFYSLGMLFEKLAKTKSGVEAETLSYQAIEKYEKAIEIKPDYYQALNNWGAILDSLARTKSNKDKETLLEEAIKKFQKIIEIKPDYYKAYKNWGTVLGNLAQVKSGTEAESLYHQAIEKYEKAVEIKPDLHEAFYNWGTHLGELAKTKSGKEANVLHQSAIEKFQNTIQIKPDYHRAFSNWGIAIAYLAKTKSGENADTLWKEAIEKCEKAIDLGGKRYGLACVYALKSDKKNALLYLEQSLKDKEVTPDYVSKDNDFKAYWKDKDFKKIIKKYSDK